MAIVKVNWSGGKDSTASVLLHSVSGDTCKIVCYVPFLTDSIPLILRSHYDFICSTASFFSTLGHTVDIITGISYYDHVHTIITRGKNIGRFRGVGLGFGFCLFRDYSKIKALDSFDCGYYDYIDIGIAYDEKSRVSQLTEKKRSILFEKKYTEADAFELCAVHHLISPHYFSYNRDGCCICPNASTNLLHQYIADYPEALPVLQDIEKFCKLHRPEFAPYRNKVWWSDRLSDYYYQYPLWRCFD